MPRVLRIINRLNLGGPTFNAALLTKHLAPEYETMLVAGMKEDVEESSEFILNDLGIEPVYISDMFRSINPLRDLPAYRQLKKIIRQFKPDIVHTHAAKAGALGRLAAIDCGVPVVVHTFHGHVFHSYFGALKTRFYIEIERWLAKNSSKIIAISPSQKNELSQTYNICSDNEIEVIPLGFDLNRFQTNQTEKRDNFRTKYQIAEDEIAIGIIGRLVQIKNHGLFLRSLKEILAQSSQKIRAFIVGNGEEYHHLIQLARELEIPFSTPNFNNQQQTPLTFTSWIKNVDEVYAGIDIVALSSLNEGTPVSLIEAQAANKPIVSTNVGGVCDVVLPGKTALISPSNNRPQFTQQLLKLVENESLRFKLGKNGHYFVNKKYHYSRLVNDVDQLYQNLLTQKAPAKFKPQVQPLPQPIHLSPAIANAKKLAAVSMVSNFAQK